MPPEEFRISAEKIAPLSGTQPTRPVQGAESPEFQSPEFQESEISKCQNAKFRNQKFQNFKIAEFQNPRIPKFQNSKIPEFRNSGIGRELQRGRAQYCGGGKTGRAHKFQNSKIPKFQNFRAPKSNQKWNRKGLSNAEAKTILQIRKNVALTGGEIPSVEASICQIIVFVGPYPCSLCSIKIPRWVVYEFNHRLGNENESRYRYTFLDPAARNTYLTQSDCAIAATKPETGGWVASPVVALVAASAGY